MFSTPTAWQAELTAQKASPVALTVGTRTLNTPQTHAKAMSCAQTWLHQGETNLKTELAKPHSLLTRVSKNLSRPQEKQQDRANCTYTSEKENTELLEQFQSQLSFPSWKWHFYCM